MATANQLLTQYDPNIPSLQSTAEQTASTANDYQSAASLLPTKLKQAIMEKLNYNQDIISQQNQAMSNYFSAPAKAREQYQNIWNPFERESLVSQATANAYAPYATLTQVLGQRQGNISDVVNAGTSAFNAQASAESNAAQQARQNLTDALSMAQWAYGVQHPTGGGVGSASYNLQTAQDAQKDASMGTPLRTMIQKYTGKLSPDDVYAIYNQFNYGNNADSFQSGQGGWGTAKETPTMLAALGITGAASKPQSTIVPITSTAAGKTTTTGWKIKTSDGATHTILPAPKTGGFLGFGMTPSTTQNQDPVKIWEDYQSAGLSDSDIIMRLEAMGFTIQ
jgi:hypothetical protein